jgi:ABC-type spermidine/putrescine transport system permease subunit I
MTSLGRWMKDGGWLVLCLALAIPVALWLALQDLRDWRRWVK